MLSFSECLLCACVRVFVCVCVLLIYTISITCVSQEEPTLIACNQQVYDFYKWIIECNKGSCCEHVTDGANIYLYGYISLLALKHAMCLLVFMYAWYQIRVPVKNHIMC